MQLASYPKIGTRAKYIRVNPQTKEFEEGSSLILAICLDPQKRIMAHMQGIPLPDGNTGNFNVDLNCLEPSDDFKAKFKAVKDRVEATSQEGNGKIAALVAEYNQAVENAYTSVLGEPVEFD